MANNLSLYNPFPVWDPKGVFYVGPLVTIAKDQGDLQLMQTSYCIGREDKGIKEVRAQSDSVVAHTDTVLQGTWAYVSTLGPRGPKVSNRKVYFLQSHC